MDIHRLHAAIFNRDTRGTTPHIVADIYTALRDLGYTDVSLLETNTTAGLKIKMRIGNCEIDVCQSEETDGKGETLYYAALGNNIRPFKPSVILNNAYLTMIDPSNNHIPVTGMPGDWLSTWNELKEIVCVPNLTSWNIYEELATRVTQTPMCIGKTGKVTFLDAGVFASEIQFLLYDQAQTQRQYHMP